MDEETKEYLEKLLKKKIELLEAKVECMSLEMKVNFSKQSIHNFHNFLMLGSDSHRDGDLIKKSMALKEEMLAQGLW